MKRTFRHTFDPPEKSPVVGSEVELTVRQIEDAGLREVLQTPGTTYGSWAVLGVLLHRSASFVFHKPLGQAREVKVALSGLFGRFVARAYLERYFGLSVFVPLGRKHIVLNGQRRIEIRRCVRGDLPDWVACTSSTCSLTVAEAKGSHDPSGPAWALKRAWAQAGRVKILSNGRQETVKRVAIVTRWGVHREGPSETWISVRDPIDEGNPLEADEKDAIFVGLFRHHIANMLAPLGHVELAESLRDLACAGNERDERQAVRQTYRFLETDFTESLDPPFEHQGMEALIGGVVTRAGPLADTAVSLFDRKVLARLDLRPVFVGIERDLVRTVAEGDVSSIREVLDRRPMFEGAVRGDRAGGWIIPLGEETGA